MAVNPARNFQNRSLCHGDNLPFLQSMNTGSVELVATDPPFNKNRDFHSTPDKLGDDAQFEDRWCWMNDVQPEWLADIHRDEPEVEQVVLMAKSVHSSGMGAFLCWLGVRLLELRRVLAKTGTIYIHIDHTAHAYVKALMDAVFGRKNFLDAIVWNRAAENLSRKKWRRATEIILMYSRSKTRTWHRQFDSLDPAQVSRDYRFEDDRGRYMTTSCTNNARRPNMLYEFRGVKRQWRYERKTMERYDREGLLVFNSTGVPRRKKYLDESPGRGLTNVWSDIAVLSSHHRERTDYPTQKPLKLYERLIRASSDVGDLVLDPFCGCATTPVAAERLRRHWVGIDLWDGAWQMVVDRMARDYIVVDGCESSRSATVSGPLPFDQMHHLTTPFIRTDLGDSTPGFSTPFRLQARRERFPHPRTHFSDLVQDLGPICQGCGADYARDSRILQVDHRDPKAAGGSDAYVNLTLLCPPCNQIKSDQLTLVGLQDYNKRNGFWKEESAHLIKSGKPARRQPRPRNTQPSIKFGG